MPRSRSPIRHRSRSTGRYRSRSRSPTRKRSRSRGRYDRKRERVNRESEREQKRPRKTTDEIPKQNNTVAEKTEVDKGVSEKNGEISLSIEETNKLRISMGLKPLRIGATKEKEVNLTKSRDQIDEDARQKSLREALEKSKQKREYSEKIKGKSLGEMLKSEATSTLDWVRQNRTKKDVGLVKSTLDAPQQYRSDELKGLTVAHDIQAFEEGEEVILTLKDQRVLTEDYNSVNDGGDELENVHISEADRRLEREERMKRASGPVYSGFDDDEFTSVIGVQAPLKKRLLTQYDEEDDFVAAREKKKFELTEGGTVHVDKVVAPQETAKAGFLSLASNKQRNMEEYFTAEEMAVFDKKKSKKLRKKQKTRQKIVEEEEEDAVVVAPPAEADFVAQLEKEASHAPQDHGKRSSGATDLAPDESIQRARFEAARKRANDRVQAMVDKMKYATDDIDEELSESLARTRRLALVASKEQNVAPNDARVVLHLTEATRAAGNIHKEDLGENAITFSEATDFEARVKNAMEERTSRVSTTSTANPTVTETVEEEMDVEETKEVEEEEEEDNWGVEEPLVQTGMAATLALLRNRGDLKDHIQVRQAGRTNDHRERNVEDELLVKDGVKLDYRDEFGRLLTKKEAFRRISYRFHGHTPGKKKEEKRLKQLKEELSHQKNLGNVAQRMQTLEKRQKAAKQAHVVLSG